MSLPVRWSWTFRHTGYVPGRRKDIEVGVVGKNRIMKYIQTGFQHLIQRIDTSKCKLEFAVPVRISVKGLLYLVEDLRKRKGALYVKDPAAFGKTGKITGTHHYKCDVLVSQETFGKRIAENKIKVAWLQQGSCLIYAKTVQRQGVFMAEDGNILFFLRKIVSNDLEIKMEACMRAIPEMICFVQNISSNS